MEPQNNTNVAASNNSQDFTEANSVSRFLSLHPKLYFSVFFLVLNFLFLFMIFFSISDTHLKICTYGSGEMGILTTQCPSVLFVYEWLFMGIANLSFWIFISVFVAFVPEFILLSLYSFAFSSLGKIKQELELAGNKLFELNVLKKLKLSLAAVPILLAISVLTTNYASETGIKNKTIKRINEREEKYVAATKDVSDMCPDAPEGIYLTTSNTAGNPRLHFSPGQWKGFGTAHLSRENYWNTKSEDNAMEYHIETYYPGIINFSTDNNLAFQPNLHIGELRSGTRYDLHVYTLIDQEHSDTISFFHGLFKEKQLEQSFTTGSSTRVNQEQCLTVTIH